jgi:hypothetical protein
LVEFFSFLCFSKTQRLCLDELAKPILLRG